MPSRLTTPVLGPALGLALAGGLLALAPATATAASEPETVTERGHVLECSTRFAGTRLDAFLYENDQYGNQVALVLGHGDDAVFASRNPDSPFLVDHELATSVKLDGTRAVLTGTATPRGAKETLHEEFDDAGQHYVVDGWRRHMKTDLAVRWGKKTKPMTCQTAFRYHLDVTQEPVEG